MNDCCDEIRNKNQTQTRALIRQESKANNHRLAVVGALRLKAEQAFLARTCMNLVGGGTKSADQKDETIQK